LKDHIVLLGTWEENSEFLLKYESFQIKNPKPVVILHMDKPSSYLWGKIDHIPNVYIVFGSFTYLEDLYRAGVRTASNLIVFSSFDQKLVVLYRSLKGTDCFKIVDLVDVNTCQFLSSVRFTDSYTTTTSFASGNVYSSSQLDTMLSQSMNDDVNVVKLAENLLTSIFSISIENVESKSNKKFKNYEDLFKLLIESNLVPMGLYREYEPNRKERYVVTNPSHDTEILPSDIVFVIYPKAPKESSDERMKTKNPEKMEVEDGKKEKKRNIKT